MDIYTKTSEVDAEIYVDGGIVSTTKVQMTRYFKLVCITVSDDNAAAAHLHISVSSDFATVAPAQVPWKYVPDGNIVADAWAAVLADPEYAGAEIYTGGG